MDKLFTQLDRDLAINYFLGEISANEQTKIEERFFEDEDYSIFLDSIEHDLIDDYVCQRLDEKRKDAFEKKYLNSAERQRKVIFAQKLQKKLKENSRIEVWESVPENAWFEFLRFPKLAFASGLATILLLFLLGWIFLKEKKEPEIVKSNSNNSSPNVVVSNNSQTITNVEFNNKNQAENNSNKINQTPNIKEQNSNLEKDVLKEIEKPKTSEEKPKVDEKPKIENKSNVKEKPKTPSFATIVLLPTMRSGEKPSLKVKPDTKFVQLKIVNENAENFSIYDVEVRDSSGNLIVGKKIKNTSKTPTKLFLVNIPNQKLANTSYETVLKAKTKDGIEKTLNFYEFRLEKENE